MWLATLLVLLLVGLAVLLVVIVVAIVVMVVIFSIPPLPSIVIFPLVKEGRVRLRRLAKSCSNAVLSLLLL